MFYGNSRFCLLLAALAAMTACASQDQGFPELTGDYLGQTVPGEEPELFAPGLVSTGMYVRDVAMTPDENEFYYSVTVGNFNLIMQTKRVDGVWTEPEVAPFSANTSYFSYEPHVTPDGQHLLFLSNRPSDGGPMPDDQRGQWVNEDIWVVDRTEDGWGEPYNLGPPVNSDSSEFFPSVTEDGTLYFTRSVGGGGSYIYRSRLVGGRYDQPERLPSEVNSGAAQYNAFIAADESYIIVPVFGREDSYGATDYYIVFRNENDEWSEPINMGEHVNTQRGGEYSPFVTRDGRYFFFMSDRRQSWDATPEIIDYDLLLEIYKGPLNGSSNIYWMDAGFIEDLRATAGWE